MKPLSDVLIEDRLQSLAKVERLVTVASGKKWSSPDADSAVTEYRALLLEEIQFLKHEARR